jgi:hypothetical protein
MNTEKAPAFWTEEKKLKTTGTRAIIRSAITNSSLALNFGHEKRLYHFSVNFD